MKTRIAKLAKGFLAIGGIIGANKLAGLKASQQLSKDSKVDAGRPTTDIYLWGNGVRTARADYLGLYPAFEPTRIESIEGLKQPAFQSVVLGDGFEGGIDREGNLHVWQADPLPAYLEEGQSPALLSTRKGAKLVASKAKQAGYCDRGIWVLHEDGSVSRVQVNILRDEDSRPLKVYFAPQAEKVKGLSQIAQLAFGESHVLARDKSGLVSCFGDDTLGQCGQGEKGRSAGGAFPEARLEEFTEVAGEL